MLLQISNGAVAKMVLLRQVTQLFIVDTFAARNGNKAVEAITINV